MNPVNLIFQSYMMDLSNLPKETKNLIKIQEVTNHYLGELQVTEHWLRELNFQTPRTLGRIITLDTIIEAQTFIRLTWKHILEIFTQLPDPRIRN